MWPGSAFDAWDHRNRLLTVRERATDGGDLTKVVDYVYDSHNRWIGRVADLDGASPDTADSIRFTYDGNQIDLQSDGSGAITRRNLWGPGVDQILAEEEVASPAAVGDVLWPLTDQIGSARDVAQFDAATATTQIVVHRVFDSFGKLVSETGVGSGEIIIGFTGRPFDTPTGLQNNLNRWYDAAVRRWISEDPIGFEAGDTNLFSYVENATNLSDPSGLSPWEGIAKILGYKWKKETCERAWKTLAKELLEKLARYRPDEQKAQEIIRQLKAMGWVEEKLGKGSHIGQGLILREVVDGKLTDTSLQWHPGGGHHGPDPYWKLSNGKSGILRTVGGTVAGVAFGAIPSVVAGASEGNLNGAARDAVIDATPVGWWRMAWESLGSFFDSLESSLYGEDYNREMNKFRQEYWEKYGRE